MRGSLNVWFQCRQVVMNIVGSAVSLNVADTAASSLFFTTHLGFREVVVGAEFVSLGRDDGAADIVLLQRDPELPPVWPTGRGLADVIVSFSVTDIAAEYVRLRREGANITRPLHQEAWGEQVIELTDPNGVVIRLIEWKPPAGA